MGSRAAAHRHGGWLLTASRGAAGCRCPSARHKVCWRSTYRCSVQEQAQQQAV